LNVGRYGDPTSDPSLEDVEDGFNVALGKIEQGTKSQELMTKHYTPWTTHYRLQTSRNDADWRLTTLDPRL